MADFDRDSMLDMFVYEMNQLIESLESTVLKAETGFGESDINEIFRVMHTIKGSAAMMLFDGMSHTAHAIEDMFFYLREEHPENVNSEKIADVVLESMDFIKGEIAKVEAGLDADGVCDEITEKIKVVLAEIKGDTESNKKASPDSSNVNEKEVSNELLSIENPIDSREFNAKRNVSFNTYLINFKLIDSCEMKNVRAYTNISNLSTDFPALTFEPENILAEESNTMLETMGYFVTIKTEEEETGEIIEKALKNSYVEKVAFRKISMGDPMQNLSKLNRFRIEVSFSDGYGIEAKNIIDTINLVEQDTVYLVCNEIYVEGIKPDLFSFEIYTDLDLGICEQRISKALNLEFYEVTQVENLEKVYVAELKENIIVPNTEKNNESEGLVENKALPNGEKTPDTKRNATNQVISVGINKLDQLLNLMGELVIAEAMVTQNPELEGLELESFYKDARQLHKIINDVQDIVMGMRMVPLSTVFFKMHRIVRDMSKQLNKEIELIVLGEETEVDKNIIEHISDPLMHMIRNSIDHGIESEEERVKVGKPRKGTVILEAKNSGGDVLIIIKDDGKGLDDKKIMDKAKTNGLLKKAESEYTQKEIHQFIFQPGFSTNEVVTNYSGRGVGMDVVMNNLQMVGGSVEVSSVRGSGSDFTMKIPLTLAIIEGMIISVGGAFYTIPIISIRQQFKAKPEMISVDPSGNEMIRTSRGEILNLIRLSDFFGLESDIKNIEDGIIICVENGNKTLCLLVDSLVGERQVVVKSMPKYIKEIRGISGCTLLGNGDISLIIDVAGFFDK